MTDLLRKFEERSATVAVFGLGYVGLGLAVAFARAGHRVVGVEVDRGKIAEIEGGRSYIADVPTESVAAAVRGGKLRATPDPADAAAADAVVLCVPTPLRKSKDPDMSFIAAAVEDLARILRPGMLVVLESTTYPGTTDEVVRPRLEAGGLGAGRDFHLAFSPERVDPGNSVWNLRNTPKVVGGVTPACTAAAAALYASVAERVVPVSSPRAAEMAKLLENTFRAVNIGLVNELAVICRRLGIDVWEVIDAAATKPYGFLPFRPGPGLGGHCIPVDPLYLSWKMKFLNFTTRFIELADQVNNGMPEYVVSLVQDALNEEGRALRGARVLLLGLTYKRDVSDLRESPALQVLELLRRKGAEVSYSDPFVPTLPADGTGRPALASLPWSAGTLRSADCACVTTDHSAFDPDFLLEHARLVVDTRNLCGRRSGRARLHRL